MPKEREWKFVVERLPALPGRTPERIVQGYLGGVEGMAVRVRITDGKDAVLTVKVGDRRRRRRGPAVRDEYGYEIPLADAKKLVAATDRRIEKRRYVIGEVELDVFDGPLAGLVLAEVEVGPGRTKVPEPPAGWKWRDVSHDPRFTNSALAEKGLPRGVRRLKIG